MTRRTTSTLNPLQWSRTRLVLVGTGVLCILVTAGAITATRPVPWIHTERQVGAVPAAQYTWDMTSQVQLFDAYGQPILVVPPNPFTPGAVYVWDAIRGAAVEVGSFVVTLSFTLAGPEATLDWSTAEVQVSFSAGVRAYTGPIGFGLDRLTGVKTGAITRTITVVDMEATGVFTGLQHYDYMLEFVFTYAATVTKRAGGHVASDTYTTTVTVDVEYVPDAITIKGLPNVITTTGGAP
jgi:hypothetical protein